MKKPAALRAALVAAIPLLASNPDCFRMWVDSGGVVVRAGAENRAMALRYKLNLVITDWTGEEVLIHFAVNEWLAINQPDLLSASKAEAYTFEADIIDDKTIDLSLEINLTEAVRVMPRVGGGFELTFVAEENPMFGDMEPLTTPAAPLTELWLGPDRLIPGPPVPLP